MIEQHHTRQFLLYVFILLIPCFTLWTVAGAQLAVPAIGLVSMILTQWFPDVVNVLLVDGSRAVLMTEFGELDGQLVPLAGAEFRLGFIVNTRVLSYSLPFYTALHFATQKTTYLSSYLWGLLILYTLVTIGLLSMSLQQLMTNVGAPFFEQPGIFVPNANFIGIFYQLNVLIVPTLAPAALWFWQSKESPLLLRAFGAFTDN